MLSVLPTVEFKCISTSEVMSSDSEDSENTEKFKEAVDGIFFPENLYKNGIPEKEESPSKSLPSLRNQNHKFESINPFTIKVTPEFQKYVAHHLSKMLDEAIDEYEGPSRKKRKKKSKDPEPSVGIKLLKNSKNFLNASQNYTSDVKHVKRHKKYDSDDDFEKKAKEVAVTPEWVLSKKEVENWAPTKGEVEVVVINGFKKSKVKKKKKHSEDEFIKET